ncbi:ATPase RavA [Planctomycetales bacterium 10988]|nr:ATPase RavA [Planctomycetales bacterium 10988]
MSFSDDENFPLELAQQLQTEILDPMKQTFIGKEEIVDLFGVCLVASENLFMLGPPGTAKSALVQELSRRLQVPSFDYLLTRFTEPNELFGPFDLRKLREGELITNTEGMLPEASLVFLDELLNANSAILNSLLGVLNERVFRRGRETRSLPLLMVVGASNRLPEEEALEALFDRFLMRVRCDNVEEEQLLQVLEAGWQWAWREPLESQGLDAESIQQLQQALQYCSLDAVRTEYVGFVQRLRQAGLAISDRRAVKLQRLVAASALLCGRWEAQLSDLWIFRYVWDTEEQQEILESLVEQLLEPVLESPQSHPRVLGNRLPDPDQLARDLEQITQHFAQEDLTETERSSLLDRLQLLAHRCEWVPDTQGRTFLQDKIETLWTQWGESQPDSLG